MKNEHSEHPLRLEKIVNSFEDAYQNGSDPAIEDFLVGDDFAVLVELIHTDLELRLKDDQPVRVESYLDRFPQLREKPDVVLELIASELELRRRLEPELSLADAIGRFPELAPALEDRLQSVDTECEPTRNDTSTSDHSSPDRTQRELAVPCPRCGDTVSISPDHVMSHITCSSCSGTFSLVDGTETDSLPAKTGRIGHFELLEEIGIGHFGSVWKARDTRLDRTVAMKIPRKAELSSAETEQFFREARAAAQLSHPNIVAVHEVGREGDTIYIVSDLVRGVTLADWMTAKRATPTQAASLCAEIAAALEHAHRAGVIHRDLKPSNIMLDANGKAHIMDFGLAKREVGEVTMTMAGKVLGTPAYMSPEQAVGDAHNADRRSDVYSLGVILFELLTGERPFTGNVRMLLHQVINDEAPSIRKLDAALPRDLETICAKALSKLPEARYQTAGDLESDLRRFCLGEPILARRAGIVSKALRTVRANAVVSLAVGAVLVLIAVAAFLAKSAHTANQIDELVVESNRLLLGKPIEANRFDHAIVARVMSCVDQVQALKPPRGEAELKRVKDHLLAFLQTSATAQDMDLLGETIELFERRDARAAATLRQALDSRMRSWHTVRDTADEAFQLESIFDPSNVRFNDGLLRCVVDQEEQPTAKALTVLSRLPTRGNVEVELEFEDGWQQAPDLGLLINGSIGHSSEVKGVAFSPAGNSLASVSSRELIVWDLRSGWTKSVFSTQDSISCVDFAPTGEQVAIGTGPADPSAEPTDRAMILDAETAEPIRTLKARRPVQCLVYSSDGKLLATGHQSEINVWDTQSWDLLKSLPVEQQRSAVSLVFSRDGLTLVSGRSDGVVTVWDWRTATARKSLSGHRTPVRSVAVSVKDNILLSADQRTLLFRRLESGREVKPPFRSNRIRSLAISADGNQLALSEQGVGVTVASTNDFPTKRRSFASPVPFSYIDSNYGNVRFSLDGRQLAASQPDNSISIWQLESRQVTTLRSRGYGFRLVSQGDQKQLRILRNGTLIRQRDVELTDSNDVLLLRVRCEGTRLSLKVNELEPLEFDDVFPLNASESGLLGVYWPTNAAIRRLRARQQVLPAKPSPLDQADQLYATGQYQEARRLYEDHASRFSASNDPEIRDISQEARTKAAFCLIRSNEPNRAARLFGEVTSEPGDRWPIIAGCQHWRMLISQSRFEDSDGVFERLKQFSFAQLAAQVSSELRRQIMNAYIRPIWGPDLFFTANPTIATNMERAAEIDEHFRIPLRDRVATQRSLLYAYALTDDHEMALATARNLVENPNYWSKHGEHNWMRGYVVQELCWLLRDQGKVREALDVVNQAMGLPIPWPILLSERARIYANLGEWENAERDLEDFFARADKGRTDQARYPVTYRSYAEAALLQGFVYVRKPDGAERAQTAWQRGLFRNWLDYAERFGFDPSFGTLANTEGTSLLPAILLGSLTGELTTDEANQVLAGFFRRLGEPMASALQGHISPSAILNATQSKLAHDFARKIALQDLTLAQHRRSPVILIGTAEVRKQLGGKRFTEAQDQLLWEAANRCHAQLLSGKLILFHLRKLAKAWSRDRSAFGNFGWEGLKVQLSPEVRGHVAYLLGLRHQETYPNRAEQLFEAALKDAPAGSLLEQLVKSELAKRRQDAEAR